MNPGTSKGQFTNKGVTRTLVTDTIPPSTISPYSHGCHQHLRILYNNIKRGHLAIESFAPQKAFFLDT